MIISRRILLEWEIFQAKVVDKTRTRIFYSLTFFSENRAVYDIMWKRGAARQAIDNNIILRMRFAFWITKAVDVHSEYVILIAFWQQQWLLERVGPDYDVASHSYHKPFSHLRFLPEFVNFSFLFILCSITSASGTTLLNNWSNLNRVRSLLVPV